MDFNISSTKKKRCKFTTLRWHNHVKKPMHILAVLVADTLLPVMLRLCI